MKTGLNQHKRQGWIILIWQEKKKEKPISFGREGSMCSFAPPPPATANLRLIGFI